MKRQLDRGWAQLNESLQRFKTARATTSNGYLEGSDAILFLSTEFSAEKSGRDKDHDLSEFAKNTFRVTSWVSPGPALLLIL